MKMGNRNKLPNAFTEEQMVRLFDEIDRPKVCMAAALAFFCGLRISEVCKIKIEDVKLSTKELKVVNSKYTLRGKTGYGKDRYVPIPDSMIDPIKNWIDLISGGKWLFPSDKSPDSPLRKKSLYEQYRIFLKQAGLEIPETKIAYIVKVNGKKESREVVRHKYNFHTLRHTYGTYLRNKGVPIEDIKEFMGHERFDTTLVYAKIAHYRKREVIDEAFNVSLRTQTISQEGVKRMTMPKSDETPIQCLQMKMVKGNISAEEYRERVNLLQMVQVKQIE